MLGLLKAAFHLVKILDFVIQAMGWGERALEPFKNGRGTSLVVQWLRIQLPLQGVRVQSLVRELTSHIPCGQKKQKQY